MSNFIVDQMHLGALGFHELIVYGKFETFPDGSVRVGISKAVVNISLLSGQKYELDVTQEITDDPRESHYYLVKLDELREGG